MQLYTPIELPVASYKISHQQPILLLGSCFADHMASHLQEAGFQVCHPFGALYNPISIVQSIQRLQQNQTVTPEELFCLHEQYHHLDFHSDYSGSTPKIALEKMNAVVAQGHAFLQKQPLVIITLGTAWVYKYIHSGKVVANCHRLPATQFARERLTQAAIEQALQEICQAFPHQTLIFTVSPIRHIKDGLHENQLSKSLLLLAVNTICRTYPQAHYFPAYEIVLDELRDYRFYNADLVHPSDVAIQYVWEKFSATYFSSATQQAVKEYEKISQMEKHKPFDPTSNASQALAKEIEQKKAQWRSQYLQV